MAGGTFANVHPADPGVMWPFLAIGSVVVYHHRDDTSLMSVSSSSPGSEAGSVEEAVSTPLGRALAAESLATLRLLRTPVLARCGRLLDRGAGFAGFVGPLGRPLPLLLGAEAGVGAAEEFWRGARPSDVVGAPCPGAEVSILLFCSSS